MTWHGDRTRTPAVWRPVATRAAGGSLLVLILILAAAPVHADVLPPREDLRFYDTGPLRIREQFLPSVGFLALEPASVGVLERGHWQLDLVQTATNSWASSHALAPLLHRRPRRTPLTLAELQAAGGGRALYLVDGEVYRTTLSARTGIAAGWELQLSLPFVDLTGGFGDRLIEGFHSTFGLNNNNRPAVPRNAYIVFMRDTAGQVLFRSVAPGEGISDPSLAVKRELVAGQRWRAALQLVDKLPLGDREQLDSSGSNDFGMQLVIARYGDHSQLHLALGVVRLGPAAVFDLPAQACPSGLVAYEHEIGRGSSVILQLQGLESPFRDLHIEDLGAAAFLFDLGVKKGFGRETVLFLALSENVVHLGDSADFGLHAGLTWTR